MIWIDFSGSLKKYCHCETCSQASRGNLPTTKNEFNFSETPAKLVILNFPQESGESHSLFYQDSSQRSETNNIVKQLQNTNALSRLAVLVILS
ncbi:MAG: hypothetical protein IJ780_07115 [Neisseriaceae bacterium]|nr:hypothetical protein [Neisseriaceae bacterium]MBR1819880.1 hypothetical protein [Neisseriaceae bacterium]